VTRFAPGDQVFGSRGDKFGAYAEFACVAQDGFLAKKPANMTMAEAATVFVGGVCPLHFLRKARIQPGERVLVHGASGSLGTFAVQLARHYGAHVTGRLRHEQCRPREVARRRCRDRLHERGLRARRSHLRRRL
jgi:NADPH:quinone reductase-like Zn-dependent oxidoreductase